MENCQFFYLFFFQIRDVGALLNHAGFTMLTIDTDELVIGYPSMFELMWDLQGMAENNAAFNRPLHLSRNTMLAASAIYQELYAKVTVFWIFSNSFAQLCNYTLYRIKEYRLPFKLSI